MLFEYNLGTLDIIYIAFSTCFFSVTDISFPDPISPVLQYRAVMMRNGVIMPVVKPQAHNKCASETLYLSLNGLGLCSGNPIFNLTPTSAGNSVLATITNTM